MTVRSAHERPLTVLIVVPWDRQRGGVISVVDNLARHLRTKGHRVLFFHGGAFLLRDTVTALGYEGVQLSLTMPGGPGLRGVLRTLGFPLLFVSGLLQLIWLLRSRRVHMVNVHYPTDSALYFAICRRLLPIRLVTSVHGRDAFYQEQPLGSFSAAFRSVIHASDAVILPSDAYRQKFAAAFPRVRERTRFIHNGIDPDVFAASVAGCQERRAADPYLLCVAELQEYKAIDVLLRAAQPLLASDPRLTLVLAGDGPLRDELEELSYALGIDRQTTFLGTQGAAQVVRLLQGCSVMVLPSRMEPFGIALLEAMACKAPVVATRVGGIPEVIEHGISGILVEPESPEALTAALQCVLADPALRERIAENGYARVMERFCATHTGSAYEQLFASCHV